MRELTQSETTEVSGGIPIVPIVLIAIPVISFGVGFFNGYSRTRNKK